MNRLNRTIRMAYAALVVAGFALPHIAIAQGRGHDKGKGEDKKAGKVEQAEVKGDKKGENDQGENRRVNAGTVTTLTGVQPVTQVVRVKRVPPGQAKKHVTTLQGVSVTRDVLRANGYQVVNVVPSGTSQVIYYRRGSMGQGGGLGPVQRIVIVPAGQVVQFQSVPQSLLSTILSRLGM
jgi:hypothetical protein